MEVRTMSHAILSDLKFALRSAIKRPGFTLLSVLILGIGIGAVTVMFGTLNTVVLRPLPFDEPERLIWAWSLTESQRPNSVSAVDYFDYREQCNSFESLAAYLLFRPKALLAGDGEPERVPYTLVSHNFFATLRVRPQLGRTFNLGEEAAGSEDVVIVSHGFWHRRLGGSENAIGTSLRIDGRPCRVVAVMPADFAFPEEVQFWLPMKRDLNYVQSRGNRNFRVFGRLAEGVTLEQAQSQATAVALRLAEAYPDIDSGWGMRLVPMHDVFFGEYRPAMLILMGAVTLLLLVACANISSLGLARAMTRHNEIAVRFALGAARSRVIAQLLTESVVIALLGGGLGLVLAGLGMRAVRSLAPPGLPRITQLGIDPAMLIAVTAVSVLSGLLFGAIPALRGTKFGLVDSLKEGGRTMDSGGGLRTRSILVVGQVAISLMLLAGAGLLIRSFLRLENVDPGFRPEGLLLAEVQLPRYQYDTPEKVERFYTELQERLRGLPGVEAATGGEQLPFLPGGMWNYVYPAERPPQKPEDRMGAQRQRVTDGYFSALGISILAGRAFTAEDRSGSPLVVIINKTMAEQFWPGEQALGKVLVLPWGDGLHMEVVGIAADVRENGPDSIYRPTFYMPFAQVPTPVMQVAIRVSQDPQAMVEPLKRVLHELDRNIPISGFHTMESRLSDRIAIPRFRTGLLGVFALISLIMASMGL
jgi:putative ABC transport system permease protein